MVMEMEGSVFGRQHVLHRSRMRILRIKILENHDFLRILKIGLRVAWGFWLWRIEWCDRHLCNVTGSDYAQLPTRIRVVISM